MKKFLFFSLFWGISTLLFGAETTIFTEAESAASTGTLGGWVLDQQFMDQIGSAVLLAHGLGEPVADAEIAVSFPTTGDYHLFIRTRDWTAPWSNDAAGRFTITLDGDELPTTFGTNGSDWAWQEGGIVSISAGEHKITLHDLTGFDGRIDALCFSTDPAFSPPNEKDALAAFRRSRLNLPETIPDVRDKPFDLVVVGGGVAGICSAVSAARLGLDVALIQNRFLLGGNNSSEIRVHLQGRMNLPPYPNLGNLVYQFQPQREGNAEPAENYEDGKKLDFVRNERNVSLYLGTHVFGVEKEGDRIKAVLAKDVVTGAELRFKGVLFADCTGDGNLGYLAGADWRMGRESKEEFGETTAPEKGDEMTMGASIQWYAVETDRETSFPKLPWAIQFNSESIRPAIHGDWNWETGLNWDQIADLEKIRDHGLRAAYGHWSFMKNGMGGDWGEQVKKMKLGWVASTAGKRESRRLMGDVVLTEGDVTGGIVWPDATVTTTWAIDLHYPDPENTKFFPGEEFRAICKTIQSPPYAIPYRCFYSRNIANLFMAGRDISVTHAALGTVRVMRTGGMMGEVVGMAASICRKRDALPRDVYEKYFDDLKALMTDGVAPAVPGQTKLAVPKWAKGLKNLALTAVVSVSSFDEKGGDASVKRINDGRIDPADANGLFVSKSEREHWVRFDFAESTKIGGLHFVSGNTESPARHFYVFQYLAVENGEEVWRDIPDSFIKNRCGLDFALTFPPVCAESFRLRYVNNDHNDTMRLWEIELYDTDRK